MIGFDIVEPTSMEEAFGLLAGDDPAVRPLGGGTALMLMMKSQLFKPERLVSLRSTGPLMRGIERHGDVLRIGGLATFTELDQDPVVRLHLPVIGQTMVTLANARVRNVATVGGNLAHADPHLDLPPVWTALDAQVVAISRDGERCFPVADLFAGYYQTTLEPGELIAALHVPLRTGWRMRYVKVTTRAAHDWPALAIAIGLELRGARISDARIVLSAATDRPTRLLRAEAALRDGGLDAACIAGAAHEACAEALIESDDRGSADYKTHLLGVHLSRALQNFAEA